MENVDRGKRNEERGKQSGDPNCFIRIFHCWVCPILFTGNRRDVEENDLIPPSNKYRAETLGDKLERYWLSDLEDSVQRKRKPSLWRALRRAFWLSYMPAGVLLLGHAVATTIKPLLFSMLLQYWSADSNTTREQAAYYAAGLIGLYILSNFCLHHHSLNVGKFGMKVRVACCSILYRKLLRLNQESLKSTAAGKLVNIMSNDAARFDFAFLFLHYFWMIPIQTIVVLYLLYQSAGIAPFVGLFSVTLLILPLQAVLTKLTAVFRRETAQRTDKRIKLMNEVINGIQVIKMYAWETPFRYVVKDARDYEMSALKKAAFIQGTFGGFMLFTERSSLFLTVLTLVLTGNMATATLVYPIQKFFSIVQSNMALILPIAIAQFSEMLISLERIQEFLMLDEREDLSIMPKTSINPFMGSLNGKAIPEGPVYIVPKRYSKIDDGKEDDGLSADLVTSVPKKSLGDVAVELNCISASWTNSEDAMTLKNITLRVRRGQLLAIIGPVGSGKSSLLQVLLKELPLVAGGMKIDGRISYSCQDSWLFADTVRENILFGSPYDSEKYKTVCKVCCLQPDLKQFPYGDQSLVGERGVTLSGGQRARINLARAIYQEADIYLLDDPLSAVDANVGRELFEGCIRGYLRGRTCVLVTHQIHFLKAADYIAILNEGAIENIGTYDELTKSDQEFSSLLFQGDGDNTEQEVKRRSIERGVSILSATSDEKGEVLKGQVQTAEERAKGNLKWSVLVRYLVSVRSWSLVIATLVTMVLTQATATGTDYWLSFWTNQVDGYIQDLPDNVEPDTSLGTQTGILLTSEYLYVYGALVVTIILMTFIRLIGYVSMSMRASKNIHDLMFTNLIRGTMRFFDTNPLGRVLNRFSKDMGAVDEMLPRTFLQCFQIYLSVISALILNCVSLPWTLIPIVVLISIFILFLRWYLNTAQAVKRLEGTTRSPMYGMINSTLTGISTIRSSSAQERLIKTFETYQNINSNAYHTYLGGSASFGFYLNFLSIFYLGTVLAIFIFIDFADSIPVGSVGLAVTQSMVMMMLLQLAARFTSDFLGQATAVERVLEYTHLPQEDNIDDAPIKPYSSWPSEGKISFQNVFLTYSPEDPPVLKNINFVIENGWKVGVVGRTGAGKSSLIAALFRLTNIEGVIQIDGIDTSVISKQDLRSKISIIPQEPVLFSASLRYNLDPFNSFSDDEIWRALEQVEMREAVPALDFKVSEGGSNFSVGQRQLLCLARAILRSNKILVMDEATANVDPQTDALIQKTIRQQFSSCTVLTIAHRLNTIMDSDRVLVMDHGEVTEFDHPHRLLNTPNSRLNYMVQESGDMSKSLREIAKIKYLDDNYLD